MKRQQKIVVTFAADVENDIRPLLNEWTIVSIVAEHIANDRYAVGRIIILLEKL